MATNHYFNQFSPAVLNESMLLEDLLVESIQIYGHDVKYLPRETYDATDNLFGEDPESKFSRAYTLEAFVANVEGFEGDQDFFSKFGLEVRDTSTFVVSRRSFEKYIPSTTATRPREGDLLYIPVMHKIFEIKFVEEELLFFSLGKRDPYLYELRCEAFRYSQEDLDTGIEEVDQLEEDIAYTIQLELGTGSGDYIDGEQVYQGANLSSASTRADVSHWNAATKLLNVINIMGTFTSNAVIIGVQSNTRYNLVSSDDLGDFLDTTIIENREIQTEITNYIVDDTTKNPFGYP